MSDAPKSYVRLMTKTGVEIDKEVVHTWKGLRESVRKFRELMDSVDFQNDWSVVVS